jgi:hypothetical protein
VVSGVLQAAMHSRLDELTQESNKKGQDDTKTVLTIYFVDKRTISAKRFRD